MLKILEVIRFKNFSTEALENYEVEPKEDLLFSGNYLIIGVKNVLGAGNHMTSLTMVKDSFYEPLLEEKDVILPQSPIN